MISEDEITFLPFRHPDQGSLNDFLKVADGFLLLTQKQIEVCRTVSKKDDLTRRYSAMKSFLQRMPRRVRETCLEDLMRYVGDRVREELSQHLRNRHHPHTFDAMLRRIKYFAFTVEYQRYAFRGPLPRVTNYWEWVWFCVKDFGRTLFSAKRRKEIAEVKAQEDKFWASVDQWYSQ